jgi:phage terminase Nu1 subunit (DNA packaging protein)
MGEDGGGQPADGLVDSAFLAGALGMTLQGVALLAKQAGCPVERHGRRLWFRWPDVNLWYWARKVAVVKRAAKPAALEELQRRRERARTEQEENELARRKGDLVPLVDYREELVRVLARIRAVILSAPGRYAPQRVGAATIPAASALLQGVAHDVLAELRTAADPGSAPPASPPAGEPS